ncbi:unnamed protein product [Heterobilharzia americana]|nr:unnamed protein product [Heterobilharzia americana]CAH8476959.1 unnamed protein product [Heterobilharzia americana]
MTIDYTARKLFDKFNIDTKQWSYSRLTVAVLAHESLGVGLLVGFWVICYKKQPLKYLTLLTPVSIQVFTQRLNWSARRLRRLPWLLSSRTDPNRILISGAESYVIRKLLSPFTIPAKIYLAVVVSRFLC